MNVTCKFKKNQSLFNCFIEISDPRVGGRCFYTLFTIIVIVLCALICGCDNWKSIAMIARARKRWLGQWIDLSSTITPSKSNEIKGIAKLIRMKDAHYVLALKNNHGRMYKKVDNLFKKSDELEYHAMVFKQKHSKDYEHSQLEIRNYTVLPMMYLYHYKHQWKDLSAFIRVQSQRHLPNGNIEEATRYYITSLPSKKHRKMNQAIREHWHIENSLHYKLGVGMNEDRCQIFSGFADRNLSIMRKIVLKLLSDDTETDAGIALQRMKAALSVRYTKKVIGF